MKRQADLTDVVDFSSNGCLCIQLVLGGQSESGLIRTGCPSQLNTRFQSLVQTLINSTAQFVGVVPILPTDDDDELVDLIKHLHVREESEIFSFESHGKVILGQSRFGGAVNVLVAEEPALLTDNDGTVQNWTRCIRSNVGFHMRSVVRVASSKIGCLFPANRKDAPRFRAF